MKKNAVILASVLCGFLIAALAFAAGATVTRQGEPSKEIQALQIEKRDVLRQKAKLVEAKYKMGNVAFDVKMAADNQLLDAEFDLATAQAQRIAICDKKLKNLEEWQTYLEKRKKGGYSFSQTALFDAQIACIDAKIQLAKEKNVGN
jgi:hypothetical protein